MSKNSRKRQQPTDPQVISQRRSARRDLQSRGLEVNTDAKTEEITGVWRPNCFNLLLRKNHQRELAAVDWLEELIRTANGENAIDRRPDFIRSSSDGAPGQNISQTMIDASRVLRVIEAGLRPWEWKVLCALLLPDAALLTRWRQKVEAITGEVNDQAQGSRVRAACEALLFVKDEIERGPRLAA